MKMETSQVVTVVCSLMLVFLSLIVLILHNVEEILVVLRSDNSGISLIESVKFKNCCCQFELSSREYEFAQK